MLGWAVPANPQPVVVGTAHPRRSQTVELSGCDGCKLYVWRGNEDFMELLDNEDVPRVSLIP
jgi:hypothetical protein